MDSSMSLGLVSDNTLSPMSSLSSSMPSLAATAPRFMNRDHRPACLVDIVPESFPMTAVAVTTAALSTPDQSFADFSTFEVTNAPLFNYAPHCDPVTLTPHSGSLSPPMTAASSKIMAHNNTYHHQHTPTHSQQSNSPQGSAKYWPSNNPLDGQVSGPEVQPSFDASGIPPYISNSLNESGTPYYQQNYSVKQELPHDDTKMYYSHHDTQPQTNTSSPYSYHHSMSGIITHQNHNPVLPQPTAYQPPPILAPIPSNATPYATVSPRMARSTYPTVGKSHHARSHSNNRVAKQRSVPSSARRAANARPKHTPQNVPLDPVDVNPLRFKPGCPAMERRVLELRRRYDGNKGKNMWEAIGEEYVKESIEAGGGRSSDKMPSKATLQMRVSRARSRWIEWPEEETKILQKAFQEVEADRYKLIKAKFEELGGGSYMTWSERNIECRLVELGLENIYYHEQDHQLIRARYRDTSAVRAANSRSLVPNIKTKEFNVTANASRRYQIPGEMVDNRGIPCGGSDMVLDQIQAVRGDEQWVEGTFPGNVGQPGGSH